MIDLPAAFAADVGHNVEYKIRDLSTCSVTLFPTQAQVKREIKDVPLKPGINEISIVGLSPTIDKHSIMVEGNGTASITAISVELLPNREIFDEIYPDSDEDESESEDDEDDDQLPDVSQDQTILGVKMKLIELRDEQQRAREIVGNADNRIKILDTYSNSLDKKEGINISEMLEVYKTEHMKAFKERLVGVQQEREVTEAINNAIKEQSRLTKLAEKARAKDSKTKAKIQKAVKKKQGQRVKRLEEKRKEKRRIRDERARCWPQCCYTVHIQLEVNSSYTPASSRRDSVSSEIELVQRPRSKTIDMEETSSCDLVLSYVTDSAFWTPSYSMQLSTVTSTGVLCFDAGIHNTTSETWENCKITLSTSQATSSNLDESNPTLAPWRIKLGKRKPASSSNGVLESSAERMQQTSWRNKNAVMRPPQSHFNREMFGLGPGPSGYSLSDYQMQLMLLEQQNQKRMTMARENSSLPPAPWEQLSAQQQAMQQQQMQQQQQAQPISSLQEISPPPSGFQSKQERQLKRLEKLSHDELNDFDFDAFLFNEDTKQPEPQPSLEFQESLIEETGFTTTFDLPGLKTLVPKFTASKQRVARLQFANVFFSHTVVAKYHPAAYLKAKLKNGSKLTLLGGPASLTLDGSFMGQTKVPRCSPGEKFTLSLGVDSSIRVMYPKPDVRRSTSGVFNKEDSSVYVRTVTMHNTRVTAGRPVNVLVLDQIPVSQDDRLRVEMSNPRGLTVEGPSQPAGAPGRDSAEDQDWGKATASLTKYGQVSWDVALNPGKSVKLRLEYSVSMPSGDVANEC
ncbi:hypothetical protein FPOAC2_06783 [Fusarium poae]|jgi:hypothetical protein|uniref:hypothetical protein n=1 Tax=Fusarium poae TaxID=36050 RepID=UPI001CE879CE|nr:hypothetical protein FPOAC1_006652 [Fusarium poae]KAG8673340.1 hypothetical protein FPOAC1_006652 [Fusarium poae]